MASTLRGGMAGALLLLGLAGCADRPRPRVLVIGLDGATFAQLDPLFQEGLLPNLQALRDRGTAGELQTILPAISPPAWTSATTGVNPGKHNIFDFFHFSRSGPEALLTSSLDRRAYPIWHFLNEDGYRTGIMNIPMTFPPDRVDGFFISGFPFGDAKTGFTYPPDLEKELGEYPLDLFGESLPPGREGLLLSHFVRTAEAHVAAAERLMQEKDWDLFWVVFTGTDKVQHFFWKYADPRHPLYSVAGGAQYGRAIRDMYVRLDRAVGRLVALAGPDTDVIVMSDHGFGPIYRELRLENWLVKEGFDGPPSKDGTLSRKAFMPGWFSGLVRVNEEGRDYQGQVPPGEPAREVESRIMKRLSTVTDSATGQPFVESIYRGEDVYHGPYARNGPDIVFVEQPTLFVGRGMPGDSSIFGLPSYTFSGYHRPNGVLLAAGPHFTHSSSRGNFSILDVAPTLYWLFDSERPSDLDGDIPGGLVRADSLAARPPRIGERTAVIPVDPGGMSESERKVLESLGYVQ